MGEAIRVLPGTIQSRPRLRVEKKRAAVRRAKTRPAAGHRVRVSLGVRLNRVMLVLCCAAVAVLNLYPLFDYTNNNGIGTQITVLSGEIAELEAERDYLTMQLEPYKESGRIETLAKQKIGMDYPTKAQIMQVSMPAQPATEQTASFTHAAAGVLQGIVH